MLLVHSALLFVISVSFKKFGKNIKRISYYLLFYKRIFQYNCTCKLCCVYMCKCLCKCVFVSFVCVCVCICVCWQLCVGVYVPGLYFIVGLRWSLAFDFTSNSTYLEIGETVLLSCKTSTILNNHLMQLYHPDSKGNQCLDQSCGCTVLGGCEIQPSSKCSLVVTISSICNYSLGFLSVNVFINDIGLLGNWTCMDLSYTPSPSKSTSLINSVRGFIVYCLYWFIVCSMLKLNIKCVNLIFIIILLE